MKKIHKKDEGTLEQVNMSFDVLGRPNPVYRCMKCRTILDSRHWKEVVEVEES